MSRAALLQIRQAMLSNQVGTPYIDLMHQVKLLCRCLLCIGQRDSRGIIDYTINTTKAGYPLGYSFNDHSFVPDVAGYGNCLASGLHNLRSSSVYCPFQLRMCINRFCGNNYIRPFCSQFQRNGFAYTPAGTGNEICFILKKCHSNYFKNARCPRHQAWI
ncbi:hypothetical protein D3C72_1089310 [compost metagenome]